MTWLTLTGHLDRCTRASLRRYHTCLINSFSEFDTIVAGAEICRSFDFKQSVSTPQRSMESDVIANATAPRFLAHHLFPSLIPITLFFPSLWFPCLLPQPSDHFSSWYLQASLPSHFPHTRVTIIARPSESSTPFRSHFALSLPIV